MFYYTSRRCRDAFTAGSILLLTSLACLSVTQASYAATWRVEAEAAVAPAQGQTALPDKPLTKKQTAAIADKQGGWTTIALEGSSGGMVLGNRAGSRGDWSPELPVRFPAAGTYHVAVRFLQNAIKPASFAILLRDEAGQGFFFDKCDWLIRLSNERPYESKERTNTVDGMTWNVFKVVIERPMEATLSFGTLRSGAPQGVALRHVDCVVFSNEDDFSINNVKLDTLPQEAPQSAAKAIKAPEKMKVAPAMPANSAWFSGMVDAKTAMSFGLINNASLYMDYALASRLGFNADHGTPHGSQVHGIKTMGKARGGFAPTLAKEYKSPIGRFINNQGKVSRVWSIHFAPARESMLESVAIQVLRGRDNPLIASWSVAGEGGGWFDYSPNALEAFHKWLKEQYKNVATLNKAWGTDYPSLDKAVAAKTVEENKASWFAFRRFSSESYTRLIADSVAMVQKNDPQNRPVSTQASNLDLLAPYFKSIRPMDWEDMITIGMKNTPTAGWDAYAADDYMGTEIDLLSSFDPDKHLILEEWNVHTTDPRIAGRTYWTILSKGIKGIYNFQAQEGTYHDSYPKWALARHDNTPKNKMGSYSDAIHQAHQFDSLLAQAKRTYAHKPVAMYYSVDDLTQGEPGSSAWGGTLDSPYHIYELLRAGGFDVRWITPRQIDAGQLSQVSAVVMADVKYIPTSVSDKLTVWVKEGGVVIADMWPGVFDQNGKAQHQLLDVFGIAPIPPKVKPKDADDGKLAVQESTQGYGEVTINALAQDNLRNTVAEIWQQLDSTHPVGKAMGTFTLSGFGRQNVSVKSGQVIGMTFGGPPAITINSYGKGQAMYCALALGSLFSGSATRYEWDSSHTGAGPYKLMSTFLEFSGVKPAAVAVLPWEVRRKLRVEAPLVTESGNVMIGLVSFNDLPLKAFDLTVAWPATTPKPRQVYFVANGSRELHPLSFTFKDQKLALSVPGFDTHGAILSVQDMGAMVSLRLEGKDSKAGTEPLGPANLVTVRPGQSLTAVATLYNTSNATLEASELKLSLPQGWFMSNDSAVTPTLKPGASHEVRFTIQSPALCTARVLLPIQVRFEGKPGPRGHIGLATAVIWWQNEKNDPTW